MKSRPRTRVLAVGFDSSEVERVSGLWRDAEFLEAGSAAQVNTLLRDKADPGIDLLLVSTEQHGDDEAVVECKQLRDQAVLQQVPMLAAITRYQMDVGHQVQRIDAADFVIQPVDKPQLAKKTRELGIDGPKTTGDGPKL